MVRGAGGVTVAELEERFGISPITARRDLAALERDGRVRRTHGGAVLPGFAGHEDSFEQRVEEEVAAKERLGRAAVELLEPGSSVFVDSSTTGHYAVRRVLGAGLRVTLLTNLLPNMGLFTTSAAPGVELVGIGGSFKRLTKSFVGPGAVRDVEEHFADVAFVSAKGVTPDGYLTDPDALEAEVKRAMIRRSAKAVLLADGRKFERRGLNAIAHATDLSMVLAADTPEERLEELAGTGVEVRRV